MSRRLASLVLLAFAALPAPAQEDKPVVPFEGTQAFRHILQFFKLEPVQGLDELVRSPPEQTVVILFGRLDVLDGLIARGWSLRQFLRDGGGLLIASDYLERRRLDDLGIQITEGHIVSPPGSSFMGWSELPLVSPNEFRVKGHPIFKDINVGIATNRPTSLTWIRDTGFRQYAGYPKSSVSQLKPHGPGWMAAGFNGPKHGRALVLAGHGLFVNGMMAQSDVDNFTFAWNTVRWLSEAENGKRKYALFVEDDQIHSDFNVPLTELPSLPMPPTRVINEIIRGIEEEDLINRIVHDSLSREDILQGMMIVLSVGLVIVAARRLSKTRYRLDTSVPLVAPSLEKALTDVPVLSQRHRMLLLQGDLFEAAQMLAQLWFEKHTAPHDRERIAEQPPDVHIKGNWWQCRKLTRRFRTLWNIAFGETPAIISRSEFERLMNTIEELTRLHAQGTLAFGSTSTA